MSIHLLQRNGHPDPGCSKGPDQRLGHWLADQRYKFRKGDLNTEKTRLLYEMGCRGFQSFGNDEPEVSHDSDASAESGNNQGPESPAWAKPARKRRFGLLTPPRNTTSRAGRATKKKKSGDYAYF